MKLKMGFERVTRLALVLSTVVTCELPVVLKSPVSWAIYFLKLGTCGAFLPLLLGYSVFINIDQSMFRL